MASLREVIAHFSIAVDDKELKKGEEGIDHFVETLKHAGEAFLAAFAVEKIHGFIDAQIENAAQLKISAERLGIETQELQMLNFAAEQAGVSSEAMGTGLRILNRNLAEAVEKGGEHAATFAKLHVALKNADGSTRSAGDVMGDLADAVARIPEPARRTQVAMQLLGRGGAQLIPLLKEGSAAFDEARKNIAALGGGLSNEFIEKAHKAEQEQKKFTFAMTGFKSEIASAVLPTLERLVDAGIRMVVNLRDMAQHTDIVTHALRAGLGVAIAMAPGITAIAAGAAVLYLAFDELYTLLRGGDTILGDALGDDKQKFVKDLRDAIDDLTGSTNELTGASDDATDSWSSFKDVLVFVEKLLARVLEGVNWLVRAINLIPLKFRAMLQPQGQYGEIESARERDLAGGFGHDNEDVIRKRVKADRRAQKDRKGSIDDAWEAENAQREWDAAQRNKAEFDKRHNEWELGGKGGAEPTMQPELAEWLATHREPSVGIREKRGTAKAGIVVNQTLNVHNELHPAASTDEAGAIGDLTDQTSTAVERANERALYANGSQP